MSYVAVGAVDVTSYHTMMDVRRALNRAGFDYYFKKSKKKNLLAETTFDFRHIFVEDQKKKKIWNKAQLEILKKGVPDPVPAKLRERGLGFTLDRLAKLDPGGSDFPGSQDRMKRAGYDKPRQVVPPGTDLARYQEGHVTGRSTMEEGGVVTRRPPQPGDFKWTPEGKLVPDVPEEGLSLAGFSLPLPLLLIGGAALVWYFVIKKPSKRRRK